MRQPLTNTFECRNDTCQAHRIDVAPQTGLEVVHCRCPRCNDPMTRIGQARRALINVDSLLIEDLPTDYVSGMTKHACEQAGVFTVGEWVRRRKVLCGPQRLGGQPDFYSVHVRGELDLYADTLGLISLSDEAGDDATMDPQPQPGDEPMAETPPQTPPTCPPPVGPHGAPSEAAADDNHKNPQEPTTGIPEPAWETAASKLANRVGGRAAMDLARLLDSVDGTDGTVAVLRRVEEAAGHYCSLITCLRPGDHLCLGRGRRKAAGSYAPGGVAPFGGAGLDPETFGAQLIGQLIEVAKKMSAPKVVKRKLPRTSMEELVRAYAEAKTQGLDDAAASIKASIDRRCGQQPGDAKAVGVECPECHEPRMDPDQERCHVCFRGKPCDGCSKKTLGVPDAEGKRYCCDCLAVLAAGGDVPAGTKE